MNYTSKEVYEFISEKNNDPIVEWKICKVSGTEFPIYESDLKFYDKISPTINGVKYQIPTPTLCPEERQRRRLAWRNERKLYKRKCDATGETIISMYSPDKEYKVYDQKIWWGDSWDSTSFGKEFDFSKSFFEQFNELQINVPHISLINSSSINSDYGNFIYNNKNCYMFFGGMHNTDSYYSKDSFKSDYCVDGLLINECNNIYESVNCLSTNSSQYVIDSIGCNNIYFCQRCIGCENCFGCIGLTNKKYHFFNKELSKDEYSQKVDEYLSTKDKSDILMEVHNLKSFVPMLFQDKENVELSFGNYLSNTKGLSFCYECKNVTDSKYVTNGYDSARSYDTDNVDTSSEFVLDSISIAGSRLGFSIIAWFTNDSFYSVNCHNCTNLFGCFGLHHKQYCILNKQYTKEEYEELVPKIIEHMQKTGERGEFFPIELSPFGYNETVAQEYYPLQQADASSKNYKWQTNNYDPQIPAGVETITKDNIPQDIQSVTDDILKKLFICEVTGRPFRIIKQELEFYKKHNLPLPTKHPDQRHLERLAKRNPRKLWKRKCDCSNCASNNNSNGAVEFLTTYSPERKEKVYCETCYNKEVYG